LFTAKPFAGGSISGCRTACPALVGHVSVDPSVLTWLIDVARAGIIAVTAAVACRMVWRVVKGTPPQRRALAVGMPVALLFLIAQALYHLTNWFGYDDLNAYLRWLFAIARSALWYGFLFALVAAQIFAADVLRRMVGKSLNRPSVDELESLLREPLGDPRLQLAFRQQQPGADEWIDGEGRIVEPPAPGSGRVLTEVEHEGHPAVAIVHDVQLADDPELIEAAAATALLAFENAELQAAWSRSLGELRESRARLAAASDRERRSIERDLHDGPQQALVALSVKLALAAEGTADADLRRRLNEFGGALDGAIEELRDLAHGIYPSALVDLGLVPSLRTVAAHAGRNVEVTANGVGRYPAELESAVYYCCREALQNALRHAGPRAHISIQLSDGNGELGFEVRDDGSGFDPDAPRDGSGLRNMQDRVGALDGIIRFVSAPGRGTVVFGSLPVRR
jgi:signal transduction histidine kinase